MRRLLLFAILSFSGFAATAQNTVTGRVVSGNEPVGYATAVLLREGVQAAGATSDDSGRFVISAAEGRYTLVVRHASYAPSESAVDVAAGATDLGDIALVANEIGTVTVTAHTVTRESDRFVLSINNAPSLAGRDGTELLALAPGVWIADSGISINGAAGTQVYVDGRQLKGSAEENAAYLRSLTAADIARIEVVPQTGAEFAADTRGGAILITLRRRTTGGMDGNLQTSTTQGDGLSNYAASGRIGARAGKWTLDASGSGSFTPQSESVYTETRKYGQTYLPYWGESRSKQRVNYGRGALAAVYDPNPRHTAGLSAEYNSRSVRMPTSALTTLGELLSDSRYDQNTSGSTFTATANYIWRIDTLGSELKIIADYTRHAADGDNDYKTVITTPDASRDSVYRSSSAARYDILTADAGLTRKLPHGLTLRAGGRYTRNTTDDRSGYDVARQQAWIALPEYGYDQHYTEQTGAAYASLALSVKRWDLSAGLRGEYTSVSSQEVGRDYFGLFPNLSVNHSLNDMRTWMLIAQYSRNIERPSFAYLNPAWIQSSDYSAMTGNPALRPTYIHRLSLTAVWKYRYTLTLGGNLHHDLIREVASTDPENPDLVIIRPENHYTEDHWFAALSAPVKITRWWNLSVNAVGVLQCIRLERSDPMSTHWLLFADATAGFTLPAGFYFEAVYRIQSRLYSGNSEIGARHTLDATIKKQLCNKKLTLFVKAANLTDAGWEFASTTDGMRRTTKGSNAWTGRSFKIGVTWNFRSGQKFRATKVESASEGDRKRLVKDNEQSK